MNVYILTDKDLDGILSATLLIIKEKLQDPIIKIREKINTETKDTVYILDTALGRIPNYLDGHAGKIIVYDHHMHSNSNILRLKRIVNEIELHVNPNARSTAEIIDKNNSIIANIADNSHLYNSKYFPWIKDISQELAAISYAIYNIDKRTLEGIIKSATKKESVEKAIMEVLDRIKVTGKRYVEEFMTYLDKIIMKTNSNDNIIYLGMENSKKESYLYKHAMHILPVITGRKIIVGSSIIPSNSDLNIYSSGTAVFRFRVTDQKLAGCILEKIKNKGFNIKGRPYAFGFVVPINKFCEVNNYLGHIIQELNII